MFTLGGTEKGSSKELTVQTVEDLEAIKPNSPDTAGDMSQVSHQIPKMISNDLQTTCLNLQRHLSTYSTGYHLPQIM